MQSILIMLTVLAAAVAASPTPEAVTTEMDASGLNKRGDGTELHKRGGLVYCGNFANGSGPNLRDLYDDFGSETYTAPAQGCVRAKCWNTSGVYVCNDRTTELTVSGKDIKKLLNNITNNCCLYNFELAFDYYQHLNGQQFSDALGGNWNVVAGYANCKVSKYIKPSEVGGADVNGKACHKEPGFYMD